MVSSTKRWKSGSGSKEPLLRVAASRRLPIHLTLAWILRSKIFIHYQSVLPNAARTTAAARYLGTSFLLARRRFPTRASCGSLLLCTALSERLRLDHLRTRSIRPFQPMVYFFSQIGQPSPQHHGHSLSSVPSALAVSST